MRLLVTTISPALSVTRSLLLLAVGAGRWLLAPNPGDRVLGACVTCQQPVCSNDPFLRYNGGYYHGDVCVELDPPAGRRRAEPAGRAR